MDIEGPSTAEGAYIQQWSYHDGNQARWRISYENSGYYSIQSVYSNKYVAVNNFSTVDGAAIIQTATLSDACKWKILVTSNGNYKFVSKLSEKVISLPTQTTDNGTDLKQLTYTDNSVYTDEWIVTQWHDVSLIAVPEKYNRTSFFDSTINELSSLGYTSNIYSKQVCMNHNYILDHMEKSKITVIRTHGLQTEIKTSNDRISISMMEDLEPNALAYSELILYGACDTGKGRENSVNLVNATHEAGAKTVIGFELEVNSKEVNAWCQAFFEAIGDGKTISQACTAADAYVQDTWYPSIPNKEDHVITTNSWYIAGDQSAILSNIE